MAEYIEREKVYETLNIALNEADGRKDLFSQDYIRGCRNTSSIVINDMKKIPAADVRPERHGEWIDFGRDNDYSHYFRCSKCGFEVVQSLTIAKQYLYCPKCGAKMDGKDV